MREVIQLDHQRKGRRIKQNSELKTKKKRKIEKKNNGTFINYVTQLTGGLPTFVTLGIKDVGKQQLGPNLCDVIYERSLIKIKKDKHQILQ